MKHFELKMGNFLSQPASTSESFFAFNKIHESYGEGRIQVLILMEQFYAQYQCEWRTFNDLNLVHLMLYQCLHSLCSSC